MSQTVTWSRAFLGGRIGARTMRDEKGRRGAMLVLRDSEWWLELDATRWDVGVMLCRRRGCVRAAFGLPLVRPQVRRADRSVWIAAGLVGLYVRRGEMR